MSKQTHLGGKHKAPQDIDVVEVLRAWLRAWLASDEDIESGRVRPPEAETLALIARGGPRRPPPEPPGPHKTRITRPHKS